jgi:hypothetical protein
MLVYMSHVKMCIPSNWNAGGGGQGRKETLLTSRSRLGGRSYGGGLSSLRGSWFGRSRIVLLLAAALPSALPELLDALLELVNRSGG